MCQHHTLIFAIQTPLGLVKKFIPVAPAPRQSVAFLSSQEFICLFFFNYKRLSYAFFSNLVFKPISRSMSDIVRNSRIKNDIEVNVICTRFQHVC